MLERIVGPPVLEKIDQFCSPFGSLFLSQGYFIVIVLQLTDLTKAMQHPLFTFIGLMLVPAL